MKYSAAICIFAILIVQGLCLEDPSESKISEYKSLVEEWSAAAKRIIRSLKSAPAEDAGRVSAQLQDALSQARSKRETTGSGSGSEGIQSLLSNVNEGLKSFMSNMTASPIYQQMQKLGESFGEKGKELVGQLEEQVKKFQQEASKPSSK